MLLRPPIKILTPPIKPSLQNKKDPKKPAAQTPVISTVSTGGKTGATGGKTNTGATGGKTGATGGKTNTGATGGKTNTGATGGKPSAGTTGSKPNTGASSAAAESAPAIPSFETIFSQMLTHYLPETVTFTPVGEDVLRDTIRNWLRPAYEQAIRERQERTARQNAELDADAWARGMGESTYVTDVKDRAYRSESQDVSDLESDYASTLAGHLYDAVREQQQRQLEVEQFNAEQMNEARQKAAQAAQSLYNTLFAAYNANLADQPAVTGGSSGGSGKHDNEAILETASLPNTYLEAMLAGGKITKPESTSITYQTAANLLARMTKAERAKLYAGVGANYAKQNAELLSGLGKAGYDKLKAQFPA